jgi:hypothetical protein
LFGKILCFVVLDAFWLNEVGKEEAEFNVYFSFTFLLVQKSNKSALPVRLRTGRKPKNLISETISIFISFACPKETNFILLFVLAQKVTKNPRLPEFSLFSMFKKSKKTNSSYLVKQRFLSTTHRAFSSLENYKKIQKVAGRGRDYFDFSGIDNMRCEFAEMKHAVVEIKKAIHPRATALNVFTTE